MEARGSRDLGRVTRTDVKPLYSGRMTSIRIESYFRRSI